METLPPLRPRHGAGRASVPQQWISWDICTKQRSALTWACFTLDASCIAPLRASQAVRPFHLHVTLTVVEACAKFDVLRGTYSRLLLCLD